MRFYLGVHRVNWIARELFAGVPLFYSRNVIGGRKSTYPRAITRWALDSGGYTEIAKHGRWTLPAKVYAAEVRRLFDECGSLDFACIQDWLCTPDALVATGMTVREHQERTVASLGELRAIEPSLPWAPVLQGTTRQEYVEHVGLYQLMGFDLREEPVVAVGSIAARQGDAEWIVRDLARLGIRMHGLGLKTIGLRMVHEHLQSSDSIAWSWVARRLFTASQDPTMKNQCNDPVFARRWRDEVVEAIGSDRTMRQVPLW